MFATPRVLVVDDDKAIRQTFAECLAAESMEVLTAGTASETLRVARESAEKGNEIHVVLLDLHLPNYGLSLPLIDQIRRHHPRAEIVPVIGKNVEGRDKTIEEEFRRYEVYDFLEKTVKLPEVTRAVTRAARVWDGRARLEDHRRRLVKLNQQRIDEARALRREKHELARELYLAHLSRVDSEMVSDQIIEAAHRLLGARDLDTLLPMAVDAVLAVVPSEATVILFRKSFEDGESRPGEVDELTSLMHRLNLRGGEIEEPVLEAIATRLAQSVASTGEVVGLPGSRPGEGFWAADLIDIPPAIHSVLCIPLVSAEHGVIGVLELFNRLGVGGGVREAGFTESDTRVLTEIASFLARGVLSFHELGHDPLTRLYNRRVLLDRTETEIRNVEKAGRAADLQTWFALADVDHFRLYNEISGYLVADGVLQDVAGALRESIREHDFVARFGGEEFCLILTRIEDRDQARAVLDRIRTAVSDLSVPNAEKMPNRAVTISIGASQIRSGDTFRDVFQRANEAIRAAKADRDIVVLEPAPKRRRSTRKKAGPAETAAEDED